MTILDTAIAVFVGVITRDAIQYLYYEVRYHLRKSKPNKYQFILDNLEEEEN